MRMPFKMLPSRYASLMRDGRFITGGRSSYVWEQFLRARSAGVPGEYVIVNRDSGAKHTVTATIEEAEEALREWIKVNPIRTVERMRRVRAHREERGLPVA